MIQLDLFGETSLRTAGGAPLGADLGGVKPRQILAILALSTGPVSKDRLAGLLWEDHPPRSYLSTLESYVCVLRRALAHVTGDRAAIRTVMHGYVLDPEVVDVDVRRFRTLTAAAADASTEDALVLLGRATALVRGELLASEAYAGWAAEARDAFRVELASVATRAAEHALALGRPADAVGHARLAVAQDDLGETACRVLMRALQAEGRRGEALRCYLGLRESLERELGSSPSAESRDLYVAMLRADDGPADAPDLTAEVATLVDLLRQAVGGMPIRARDRATRALDEFAAELAPTG
ncbi:AfsR/SARP family transcriptional regulator [Nocardioides okcheonensis]|uniref:AfsR/SARP family transcriptional regulator n=1 Tax=Nocardioides okcheonensis TaxID=2894081 RepID=UPI001E59AC17|nr:BTAD domain-containing putative transcriptional regulator [Nocardioides okcheonensis]UFN46650.1 hypothetical protein LN652_10755 [Nocardioides okcheonensis]